MVKKALLF